MTLDERARAIVRELAVDGGDDDCLGDRAQAWVKDADARGTDAPRCLATLQGMLRCDLPVAHGGQHTCMGYAWDER